MRPTSGSAIYRPDLGQAVMEFIEEESSGLIGTQIFPIFRTGLQSSTYPVIPKEALMKLSDVSQIGRASCRERV